LLAAASLTLAAGGSVHAASFLGSIAAAVEAQQLGNHPVSADQILAQIATEPRMPHATRIAS